MWKIVLAFIVFAGLALWMLSKGGDIDMSGEKHGGDAEPAHVAAVASAPVAAASAASAPASSAPK